MISLLQQQHIRTNTSATVSEVTNINKTEEGMKQLGIGQELWLITPDLLMMGLMSNFQSISFHISYYADDHDFFPVNFCQNDLFLGFSALQSSVLSITSNVWICSAAKTMMSSFSL